ncbi:MAG TPA: hypothetical protein VK446_13015 [Methylocystis sp.]|nr:hypothetical protein [Methylocystis sp.]
MTDADIAEAGCYRDAGGLIGKLRRLAFAAPMLALADQAVVSGASFCTTVMVGRWSSPGELGVYALATSIMISCVAIQDALISLPYAILRHERGDAAAEHAGSSLLHNTVFSALCSLAVALCAALLDASGKADQFVAVLAALALAAPFSLLREFARRHAFAQLNAPRALALDCAVAVLQIAGLCLLGAAGRMSASAALLVVGAACGPAALAWAYASRQEIAVNLHAARAALAANLRLGRWLFASQAVVQIQTFSTSWLTLALLGVDAAGVLAAATSVVAAANPFIAGLNNFLTPRAVLIWNSNGLARLLRQTILDAALLAGVVGMFCVAAGVAGEDVVRLLFHGGSFEGQGRLVLLLTFALLAAVVGAPAANALAAMQRPNAIFGASVAGAATTILLVSTLILKFGLIGAAWGWLAGNLAGSVARWIVFGRLTERGKSN